MDLADALEREVVQIALHRAAVVGRRDEGVAEVQQQATAGAPRDGAQELGLAQRRRRKGDVGSRVFQQQRAPDGLLHLVDVRAHGLQRGAGVGQRQQVVVEHPGVAGPGQVLRNQRRLVAPHQLGKARQVGRIQHARAADGQAHAMHRQRKALAQRAQHAVRRPAGTHVVLGMHLEQVQRRRLGQDLRQVFGLEAGADHRRGGPGRVAVGSHGELRPRDQDLIGVSEPCPPPGSWMLVQVPARTNFQALPWKSMVDVPWQLVPGPAAQSFWPFSATP